MTTTPPAPRAAKLLALVILAALLAALPYVFRSVGYPIYVDALIRAVILAVAVVSLNFLVYTAGMVSFGHAAFYGLGAYATGICAHYGLDNGFVQLAAVLAAGGVFALVTGALALRTKGVHFIMITLAFSQVVYYVILGIEEFGSDDGLTINASSAFPLINLGSKFTLYWTALAVLLAQVVFFGLLKRARFGLALAAAKESERRVRASGLDPYGYKLVAYVLAGMLAALSGFLYANLTSFVTPDTMKWTQSGEFLFIIILGGMIGPAIGPLAGAVFYVFLEETLSGLTVYWHFWFGAFLVVAVMIGTQRFRRVWKFFAVGWRQ